MLKFYLATVVIWMIIIQSLLLIFKDTIKKRYVRETKKANIITRIVSLFAMSAVPVLRLIIAATIVYIATCSQEDFDKFMSNAKDKQ